MVGESVIDQVSSQETPQMKRKTISKKIYNRELNTLQEELVKLQEWVRKEGLRVVSWILASYWGVCRE